MDRRTYTNEFGSNVSKESICQSGPETQEYGQWPILDLTKKV